MAISKRPSPNIDRRDFLGIASVVGTVILPVSAAVGVSHAALASPQAASETMTRDIERFEKRIDLIRQSLDIPGMPVAVIHRQEPARLLDEAVHRRR